MPELGQQINININVNAGQAVPTLDNVSKGIEHVNTQVTKMTPNVANGNNALFGLTQVVRDAPYGIRGVANNITVLSDQFIALAATSGGAINALRAMGVAMLGAGGISFAISVVVSLLDGFYGGMKKASSGIDMVSESAKNAVSSLIKLKNPLEDLVFGVKPDEIEKLITVFNKKIKELQDEAAGIINTTPLSPGFGGIKFLEWLINKMPEWMKGAKELSDTDKKRLETLQETVKQATKMKETLEITLGLQIDLYDALGRFAENEKEQAETEAALQKAREDAAKHRIESLQDAAKLTGDILTDEERMVQLWILQAQAIERINKVKTPFYGYSMSPVSDVNVNAPKIEFSAEEQLQINQQKVLITETANFMTNAFKGAWESIFGEANSLFEQFMSNVASRIFELEAMNFAKYFLGFLPGGSLVTALFGNKPTGYSRGSDTAYIVIDGETYGKAVINYLPDAMNRAVRERAISW